MKLNRLFKIKILILSLFSFSTTSCSKEDNVIIKTNYSYIQFTHDKFNNTVQSSIILSKEEDLQQLAYPLDLNIEDFSMISSFQILSDSSSLIVKTGETFGFMRIRNNHIEIYKIDLESNQEKIIDTIELDFAFREEQTYTMGFSKNYEKVTFFVKENDSDIFNKTYDIYNQSSRWAMYGKPFILVQNGIINVTQSVISSNYKTTPKVSVYGDSFVQGNALILYGSDISHKWSTLLAKDIGLTNCFIEGIGGTRISEEWFNKFRQLNSWFKSKYVIISLGTNNRDVDEYKKYMTQAIDLIKQNNQIPILVTVTPRNGYNFNETGAIINQWVKSSGEKYIDMHKAVTKENDPSSWIDGYVLPDNMHPTINGYKVMYNQLKSDCPFLFE